jgi:hypothetical protein
VTEAREGLYEGTLTLGDIVGLTTEELGALRRVAGVLRQRGQLEAAAGICGVITAHYPLDPSCWLELAALLRQQGQEGLAGGCASVAGLLPGGGRDEDR